MGKKKKNKKKDKKKKKGKKGKKARSKPEERLNTKDCVNTSKQENARERSRAFLLESRKPVLSDSIRTRLQLKLGVIESPYQLCLCRIIGDLGVKRDRLAPGDFDFAINNHKVKLAKIFAF